MSRRGGNHLPVWAGLISRGGGACLRHQTPTGAARLYRADHLLATAPLESEVEISIILQADGGPRRSSNVETV